MLSLFNTIFSFWLCCAGECCDMVVTWVTFNVTDGPQVKFNQRGSASAPTVAKALMTKFVDDGEEHVVRYIYRAEMSELQPSTSYGTTDSCAELHDICKDTFT